MFKRLARIWKKIRKRIDGCFLIIVGPRRAKYISELRFWISRATDGPLTNDNYIYYYTTVFGLEVGFYAGKKILDIGCGPRGSLEWADMAAERIGLDPLVDSYRRLGIDRHKMKYVKAFAEKIPFPDGCFDVVSSINSLDHVDDLDATIREMIRVIAPAGCLLLLVEVNHTPTKCEPITFSWDITTRFLPEMVVVEQKNYEFTSPGRMFKTLKQGRPYNHADTTQRTGILAARFRKTS